MARWFFFVPVALVLVSIPVLTVTGDEPPEWESLAEGLDLGRFPAGQAGFGGDETVVVLRADPESWSLDLLCSSGVNKNKNLTSREWCEEFGLTAAINGGMFDVDYLTHVGYCAARGHENNPSASEYQSVAAFCPRKNDFPSFRMFDLDVDGVSLDNLKEDYGCLVQNLRLIKRPRENRWKPQEKRWSEAALGEDSRGRILFIFCRTGYSMYDFNEILLGLPIDLVSAHHLEGGPEAQMSVVGKDKSLEFSGSYETGFYERTDLETLTRIPVVLGLRPKDVKE